MNTVPQESTAALPALLTCLGLMVLVGCGHESSELVDATPLPSPAGAGSAEPHLTLTPDGQALLSWLEETDTGMHALRFAVLDGDSWSAPREITRSADWFVNWADFPSVEVLSGPRWAAHWLVKRPGGTYAYDVAISQSLDSGATWSEPFTPHDDGTATEHGFVSLFPWSGAAGALWLDGRRMTGGHAGGGAMTLRAAIFGPGGGATGEWLIDDRVCDCCQTDAAVTPDGIVAVYRNRSQDEVRDIAVVRFDGQRWSEPWVIADDGWRIAGCPVNGPAIAARGDRVGAAWFTAAGGERRVYFAASDDAGRTFGSPARVDDGAPIGRVDVAMLEDGAIVSWLAEARSGEAQIRLRSVDAAGGSGDVQVLATTSAARSSGFPQMVASRDGLVFAWTATETPSRVRTAVLPLSAPDEHRL
ncbi:hypothetical protein BH24PSE2_BH24PSE2_24530 [soil metagenome]